jgi:hypothetical protein
MRRKENADHQIFMKDHEVFKEINLKLLTPKRVNGVDVIGGIMRLSVPLTLNVQYPRVFTRRAGRWPLS